MTVRSRIQTIRLLEKIQCNPEYAEEIGLSIKIKEKEKKKKRRINKDF